MITESSKYSSFFLILLYNINFKLYVKIHVNVSILGNQNVEGGMPGTSHGTTELNQEQQGESEFTICW